MGLPVITLDECSIDLTARMKKVWAIKGSKPVGLMKYSIKRTHVIGALFNNKVILEYAEKVNSERVIEFLENLKSHCSKFILIMDNAGWHRSKEIKAYLEINKEIIAEYLPPYSPELNPTETVWKIMRRNVFDSNLFEDLIELKLGIMEFISSYEWNIDVFKYLCR
ncbi:IS630 family transposase [Candidatus Woesearchaeota archaeon]|nr:IS630 family transposase [Candidatus Woesearchaeota archaeon]